jgi:pimeloyl-ACP methyl ester carboxylesterase
MSALHHEVIGPEEAPTVLMGGSLGTTLQIWKRQRALSERMRLVQFDHRGHGGSPVPPPPASLWQERAGAVLEAGSVEPIADAVLERWLTPSYAAAIRGARNEVVESAAHLAAVEQPQAVNRLILEHLT